MWEFCFTINGKRHCFRIPVLIPDIPHRPVPGNYPELELAIAVLQLVKVIQPAAKDSQLTKQLSEVAKGFIQQVQKGLPQGVELKQMQAE
jgi:hypothetical protein